MADNSAKTLLDRKASRTGLVSQFILPPFPSFPDRLVIRYPELEQMQEDIKRWTDNVNKTLTQALSAPQTK